MADAEALISALNPCGDQTFVALVPNQKGYERAIAAGLRKVRLLVVASETFNRKNVNRPVDATVDALSCTALRARQDGVSVAAIIGASFGCPYEGHVPPDRTLSIAKRLHEAGIPEIVFADTTGMANPRQVYSLIIRARKELPHAVLGCHFHNTRNTGFSCALAALQAGVTRLDASIAGLGGCPFAPMASGNIATEDLVHMLNLMGIHTGIDLDALIACATWVEQLMGRPLPGQVMKAGPAVRTGDR